MITATAYYLRDLSGRNLAPGTAAHDAHRAELRSLINQAHVDALAENDSPMRREIAAERAQLTAAERAYADARIARLG